MKGNKMRKRGKRYIAKPRKKEGFMQAVIALMFSQILIKLLGLVYNLYLTNKQGFGDEGNAISGGAYQIYALLLTISSIGVPNAISKLVSARTAVGDERGAHRIFKIAIGTFAIIGLIGSAILFFGARFIANTLLQIPEAELTLVALSPAIFFVAISSVIRGYFNGKQNMRATANSQTLEQLFKTTLTIGMVSVVSILSNVNTVLMAAAANLATTFSIFLSFSYLYIFYKRQRRDVWKDVQSSPVQKRESIPSVVKKILCTSIPMALSSMMSAINKNIDSFTVVRSLKQFLPEAEAKAQYGILGGKVDTLTSLPLSFNIAFATALVPTISAAMAKGDPKTAQKRVSFSLLITMLIGLPCTVGMFIFAAPILNLLYPNANAGELILQISSLTIIFTVLAQTVNGALQGFGKIMVPATALGVGVVAKFILNLILVPIPWIGACGAAIGSVVCHMISFTIGFTVLRKTIPLNLGWKKFLIKPAFCTGIMAVCSYALYQFLGGLYTDRTASAVAMLFAVLVYGLSLLAFKVLTKEEIFMLPYGQKIYKVLLKLRIYREN